MPINDLRDIAYPSGNPALTGKPQQAVESLAPWEQGFLDTSTTPAIVGQLVRLVAAATNTGGARFVKSAVAAEVFLRDEVGVVISPVQLPQRGGVMVYKGTTTALATTGATAIAAGTLLAADGAGNLTVAPTTPTPGQIVARALGPLAANTTTATLIPVYMGGV